MTPLIASIEGHLPVVQVDLSPWTVSIMGSVGVHCFSILCTGWTLLFLRFVCLGSVLIRPGWRVLSQCSLQPYPNSLTSVSSPSSLCCQVGWRGGIEWDCSDIHPQSLCLSDPAAEMGASIQGKIHGSLGAKRLLRDSSSDECGQAVVVGERGISRSLESWIWG